MFAIKRTILPNNGSTLEVQKISATELVSKKPSLSNGKSGLNFWDDEGFYCFARFSKKVKSALADKTYTVAQLLAFGGVSHWTAEDGSVRYTLITPEELRTQASQTVGEIASTAKPLAAKATTFELAF